MSSSFSFNDTVATPGLAPRSYAGSDSHSDWLPGGYVAGDAAGAPTDQWALVAGARFQDVGHYTQPVNGREASLDLSKSIFVTLGLTYSF